MTAFVMVPDQHAGLPIPLLEAIDNIAGFAAHPYFDKIITGGGLIRATSGAWVFLHNALSAGAAIAHIQCTDPFRHVRIPPSYWKQLNGFYDDPPVSFKEIGEQFNIDPAWIGHPIVIWEGGWDRATQFVWDLAKSVNGTNSETSDAPSNPILIARGKGRPRGTGYPEDKAIVRRVIRLCDSGQFPGPASVTHAIQSIIDEIEPRSGGPDSWPNKIRRIRKKVLKERPTLNDPH